MLRARPGVETLSKPITRDGGSSSHSCNRLSDPWRYTMHIVRIEGAGKATRGQSCIRIESETPASKPKGSDPGVEKVRDVGGSRQRVNGAGPGRGHGTGRHRELDVIVG